MPPDDRNEVLGAASVGALALFFLPLFEVGFFGDLSLSTLFGGGAASYLSLRKDDIGEQTRRIVGKNAVLAAQKAKDYEREQKLTEKAKAKVVELWNEAKKSI